MPEPVITTASYLAFREDDLVRRGVGVDGAFNDACLKAETHLNCASVDCARVLTRSYGWAWYFYDRDAPRPSGVPERPFLQRLISLLDGRADA